MIKSESIDPLPAGVEQTIKQWFDSLVVDSKSSLVRSIYQSKSGSFVGVDMDNYTINGRIIGHEMDQLAGVSGDEEATRLRRRVSRAMAREALKSGSECDDYELEYLALISPSDVGTVCLLFNDPAAKGMITSRREGEDGEVLEIESRNIENDHQQRVLLGGVVELLFNLDIDHKR